MANKLTKAEEQLMQVLWTLDQAFLREIMEAYPEPKPAQSTVSTILRILVEKGFVRYEAFGKSHRYHPVISRKAYAKQHFRYFLQDYFNGSFAQLLSFFSKEGDLDMAELESLLKEAEAGNDQSRCRKLLPDRFGPTTCHMHKR